MMTFSDYQRLVIAFHGCDRKVADAAFSGGQLNPSLNDYDWLGQGIYFWEHGPARALEWANFMATLNHTSVKLPSVVGALIQLGNCFDLLDVRYTAYLKTLYPAFLASLEAVDAELPKNARFFHRLDCAFLNWAIPIVEKDMDTRFQTVRGVFIEGESTYPGACIFERWHIQIAVRDASAIVGYFYPSQLDVPQIYNE